MQKTVLITGASKGIGLAIAKKLLENNMSVYGVGRNIPQFKNKKFHFFKLDLTKKESLQKLDNEISKLDVLINNAGVGYFRPLEELSENEIEEMIALNLHTPLLLTKTFLPKIKKSEGNIINIGSQSALIGEKMGTVYCATKFGMRGFTEALFAECRNKNVRVTLINPGVVNSSFFDNKNFGPESNELCYVTPEDVAFAVLNILQMRKGSIVKEINLYPQKHSLVHKK